MGYTFQYLWELMPKGGASIVVSLPNRVCTIHPLFSVADIVAIQQIMLL